MGIFGALEMLRALFLYLSILRLLILHKFYVCFLLLFSDVFMNISHQLTIVIIQPSVCHLKFVEKSGLLE